MRFNIGNCFDTAINFYIKRWKVLFETVKIYITQWRSFAILLRAKDLQPRRTGMNNKARTTCRCDFFDKIYHKLITIKIVDTNTMFNGHRNIDRCLHVLDQISNRLRLCHEASANFIVLDAIRGATDVDIDLIVAMLLGKLGTLGHLASIGTAKL